MKTPSELTRKELEDVVQGVLDALYPHADLNAAWSPDTLDDVATVLSTAALIPEEDEVLIVHCDSVRRAARNRHLRLDPGT